MISINFSQLKFAAENTKLAPAVFKKVIKRPDFHIAKSKMDDMWSVRILEQETKEVSIFSYDRQSFGNREIPNILVGHSEINVGDEDLIFAFPDRHVARKIGINQINRHQAIFCTTIR